MALKRSQRELQDCFRLHLNQIFEQEVMDAQSSKCKLGQFRDSTLGIPGKSDIRM
jgi:hypothetical protein